MKINGLKLHDVSASLTAQNSSLFVLAQYNELKCDTFLKCENLRNIFLCKFLVNALLHLKNHCSLTQSLKNLLII